MPSLRHAPPDQYHDESVFDWIRRQGNPVVKPKPRKVKKTHATSSEPAAAMLQAALNKKTAPNEVAASGAVESNP